MEQLEEVVEVDVSAQIAEAVERKDAGLLASLLEPMSLSEALREILFLPQEQRDEHEQLTIVQHHVTGGQAC